MHMVIQYLKNKYMTTFKKIKDIILSSGSNYNSSIGPIYCHTPLSNELRDKMVDDMFEEQKKILTKKGTDYAGSDVLSNFRLAGMIVNQNSNHPDAINCLNLIGTKVARLGQLLSSESTAQNESIQDSVIDLANYAVLLNLILKLEK